MLFNSFVFLVFACLFFLGWFLLRGKQKLRWIFLIAASLFFYGWWDWRYIFLLLYTGFIDFSAGIAMERYPSRKRLLLALSIFGNVGSLAIFKYLGFATVSANFMLRTLGVEHQLPVYNLLLPVGISFYTFESLSYTIDVYKDRVKPTHDILHFFSFLALFPHLVAGPIIRPYDLLPQIAANKRPTEQQKWDGLSLIARGFFKKMVIADNLAAIVNSAFSAAVPQYSAPFWWVIVTMFAFQIYCDFSGYTDIARGLAKWIGYEFPLNFNHPYIADSIRDFWSRWHISLSTWFRDYVYIPLGGSKKGNLRSHVNMWITMVVSGLWHGAAWHFVIWGALHAFYLTLERITLWPKRVSGIFAGRLVGSVILITMVWVAWVFFRATTAGQAAHIVSIMFSPRALDWSPVVQMDRMPMLAMCVAALRESYLWLRLDGVQIWQNRYVRAFEPVMISLVFVASIFWRGPGAAFIYFQF
ncbi:MAG: MBOAT family O-acyltransferase [Armatimonadota bacterium]|nr:MBOAT family O-acyltransferase [Armatimonadota bacterium]